MNQSLQRAQDKGRELKCVNGAMYFGCVDDDSCNCKTRCQNEQTYKNALKEFDEFIAQTRKDIITELMESEEMGEKDEYQSGVTACFRAEGHNNALAKMKEKCISLITE